MPWNVWLTTFRVLIHSFLVYPDSLRVVLHFVHLKNVIVEWIVSSAASTFQVSLWVFPHFSHTKWTVGSCLSIASSLWSITAISATLLRCRLIFLFASLCSIGFWYLHFGHLSVEESFFAVWSIVPHLGQKSIVFTCAEAFLTEMIFMCCDFYVTNNSVNVPFGAIEASTQQRPHRIPIFSSFRTMFSCILVILEPTFASNRITVRAT